MAQQKTIQQKYRFEKTKNGLAFESRYYAERFVNEILMQRPMSFNTKYEVVKIIDWFYIFEVRRVVVDEDFVEV